MPHQTDLPLVTVGVPTYNSASLVEESLRSILAQSYPHLEVLVVDDGSDDDTEQRVQALSDPRIRYVRNATNLGGYQTMNRVIDLARGRYVAIYHADDVYEPTIVEKEVDRLESDGRVGAVFAMDHYMDPDGRVFGGTDLPKRLRGQSHVSFDDLMRHLVRHKNTLVRCPTFMARRSTLAAVGPFDAERYDIAADLDMWLRLAKHAPIAILDERLVRYRVGRQQWSSRYNRLRTVPEVFFEIVDRYLEEDGWWRRLDRGERAAYAFLRREDETFRAANLVLLGEHEGARALLGRPFPWRAVLADPRRRKARVILQRALLRLGLATGATPWLRRLFIRTEYGGSL